MNRLKSLLVSALLLSLGGSAMAQATYTAKNGDEYEFKKHAFLNLQGGAQYTLGESSFSDLISPNVQLGLGYQFSPVFGARLAVNAWQSMGGFNGTEAPDGKFGNTTFKYKYVAPGVDAMFNLSNLICGWNPNRVFNVTAFLGVAANVAFDNDEANALHNAGYEMAYNWDGTKVRLAGRGGLEVALRVSKAVSILLEGNANILNDHYNSKKADNADWYFNGLLGLRINLGNTYTKKEPVKEEPVVAPEPVAPVVEPAPVVEEEVKVEPLRRDIFFKINSSAIADTESGKVKDIVEYLNKYPEANIVVTGYADAGTGNNKINDRLAQQRAKAVVKALVEQYGIAVSRVTFDSKGSRVQPFAENDMNRVSICIAE